MSTKTCNKCDNIKSIDDFRVSRRTCNKCENKERYQRKKNRRKIDPEYDRKVREYDVYRKRKKEKSCERTMTIQRLRQLIRHSFKRRGYSKNTKTIEVLGESWDVVKLHFEKLFKENMSWDNYGEWEIDHIIPISTGKTIEDVIKLCHYSNLQPLWKKENNIKGSNIYQYEISYNGIKIRKNNL